MNPVYFSYREDDYSSLFISLPGARHMNNIDHDSHVAVTVFSTEQPSGSDVRSIQLGGIATKVADDDIPTACAEYFAGRALRS